MNLPEEYVGLSNYRATLGHFVNHSFRETNAEFVPAFHPRFGDILAVRIQSEIVTYFIYRFIEGKQMSNRTYSGRGNEKQKNSTNLLVRSPFILSDLASGTSGRFESSGESTSLW